jgi:hypothetical protein
VVLNAVKVKFPDIEKHPDLISKIKFGEEKKEKVVVESNDPNIAPVAHVSKTCSSMFNIMITHITK